MKKDCAILFLIFVCLTPFLWFKDGFLITGADINFPLKPLGEFLRRTQAWDGVYQGGRDNTMNFATLVFTGIQAFFYLVTRSLIWTEKLSFAFWFMFTGFSIYFLVSRVIFRNEGSVIKIATCLFYLFNFYQLSTWAGVHIAGITALAVLPVMFGLFIRILNGKNILRNVSLFCLFSVFSSGLWINPPQLVVFGSVFLIYLLFHLGGLIKQKNFFFIRQTLKRCVVLGILYILLNSYTILPFIEVFKGGNHILDEPIKDYNVVKYMDFQSAYSSPLNVLRLMGNSELYQRWTTGEYYFPFFEKYIRRRLFIPLSFILPVLAFIGVILNSKDRFVRFLFCLAVIGIILGMGPHPPIDRIYPWLISHLPGFYIFRSPWLRFSLLTMFSYSILAGMGCMGLFRSVKYIVGEKRLFLWVPNMFISGVLGLYLFFMHSFIFGQMYTPVEKRVDLGPLHIKVPDYVFSCGDWINSKEGNFAVSLLPEEMCNMYEWGYSAIDDVLTNISNKEILYGEYKEAVNVPPLIQMYHLFIKALYNEMTYKIENFLSLLGVRYIIQRNDFRYYFYGDRDSPRFIRNKLKKQKGISYDRSFGEWDVYENSNWRNNYIHLANFLICIQGDKRCLLPISELMDVFPEDSVFLFSKDNEGFNLASFPIERTIYIRVNDGLEQNGDGVLFFNPKGGDIRGLDRDLWINKSGEYYVFAKLKTNIKELISMGGERILFPAKDISGWNYKPNEVDYEKKVSEDNLMLDVTFNGDSKEDEYVQIRRDALEIDLEEYPFFTMEYMLDSPAIQTIEFIFGLDFDGDRQIDGYLKGFRTTDPGAGYKRFKIEILSEVMKRAPLEKRYNLILIELYCHKYWGIDCSQPKTRGNYRFRIRWIKFSQIRRKGMVELYDYGFKITGKDIEARYIRLNNQSVKVYIPVSRVDLLKYPEVKVRYRLRYPSGARIFTAFLMFCPRYGEGGERLIFIGRPPVTNEYSEFRVNLIGFKDLLKDYYLKDVVFKIEGDNLNLDMEKIIKIKDIRVFNSNFTNRWQRSGSEYRLLGINNNVICLDEAKKNDIIPKEAIISRELYMDKGENRLSLLLDKDGFLNCQWICLLPEMGSIKKVPGLSYEKISETLCRVRVSNIGGPFIMVMENNYDKRWKMYIRNRGSKWKEIGQHFMANGFANAWLVNGISGDVEIIIKYYLQDLFKLGLWD